MRKDGQSTVITPGKLRQLENPRILLSQKQRNLICIKDVVPNPKKNTKLNLTLKSSRNIKESHRLRRSIAENYRLPSFLFDFLDEERPQAIKPSRGHINIFDPPLTPERRYNMINNSLSIPIDQEKFPDLNEKSLKPVRDIKTSGFRKRSLDPSCLYKPYVIEITPRSSVTLYGVEPISINFASADKSPKKHRKYTVANTIRNITGEKYKKNDHSFQPVVINSPAKSFAEKLQRVQDIAKEAEDSFNS